jgi:hypothetical protein
MRYDHFSMLPEQAFQPRNGRFNMTLEGGSSPAPAPANTTQTTIPAYAKPYMERLVGKAEALTDKGYQTFDGERLAASTPEQQAARQAVAGMGMPGQFAAGTELAGLGGIQSLGAGQQYMGMVTDPAMLQSMMSPYQQAVTDIAKRQAAADAMKIQQASNLGAARQGTYGGSRQLLAQTEREKALGQQLTDIQTKGLQSAYDQALKNVQFGTQAGLTGAQQAAQAGATLGQLGTAQQGAGLQLAQAQEQFGALGQKEKQAALDQAYQDFITQQQHPYKQLGFMSDLLRGSASLASTGAKSVYEAPPSTLSQIGGLGLGALGLYNMYNQGTGQR